MNIDFFVHPEHAKELGNEDYQEYISRLKRTYEQSECPILISGYIKGDFDDQFPLERKIESASYHIYEAPIHRGEVAPTDWEKFTALIKEVESYRVHGSFFGLCAEGFAVQLFAHLKRGEHWNNWRCIYDEDELKIQNKLRRKHERKGDFKNSPIKYGIVLSNSGKCARPKKPFLKFFSRIPHGNITHQLIDEETVVYF